jgi:hypothetical protein
MGANVEEPTKDAARGSVDFAVARTGLDSEEVLYVAGA